MQNFQYYNPVRIVFGKGQIAQLPELMPKGAKVMLLYGGGSIKKNGVYDQVQKGLDGFSIVEFGGIEPNPEYETCMKATALARKENVTFLLAVGGGSVIDATKFIAAAIPFAGDPWTILSEAAPIASALPLGTVLTLPATGSEMNSNAVISRRASHQKLALSHPLVFPIFSILDPETTYSLPYQQIENGIIDAFVHTTEQYVTLPVNAALQDRQAEAILLTLIEGAPKLKETSTDYNARATFMWTATNALNFSIACGVPQDWTTHAIGHELTAFLGFEHARSLALVLPALWTHQKENKLAKLSQYGRRVWGLTGADADVASAAIEKTREFFEELGAPTRFSAFGFRAEEIREKVIAALTARNFVGGELGNITPEVAGEILLLAQ